MTTKRTKPKQAGSPRALDRWQKEARAIARAQHALGARQRRLADSIGRAEQR